MPFNLQLLNQLTHMQLDEAISYVCVRYFFSSCSVCPLIEGETAYQRLFKLINPSDRKTNSIELNLKILAKLLGGRDYELGYLIVYPDLYKATTIFLKFKIQADYYQSESKGNNTCLHDALVLCPSMVEELTELLIEHGACPAKYNDNGFTAADLYFKKVFPIWSQRFNTIVASSSLSFRDKLLEHMAWIIDSHPSGILKALKIVNCYIPLKNEPGLLHFKSIYWKEETLLDKVVDCFSLGVVKWMIDHEINFNVVTMDEEKPIHIAVERLMGSEFKNTYQLTEVIEMIAHLLMCGLKYSFPQLSVLTASHVVDALLELDIPVKEYKKQIACAVLKLDYFQPLCFSEKDLIALLDFKQEQLVHSEIIIDTKIGEGTYGKVYKAFRQGQTKTVEALAIKFFKERPCHRARQESIILSQLNHPNIVRFICTIERECYGYVMQYAYGGALNRFLKNDALPLSQGQLYSFSLQINAGLRYLHEQGYVHLDLKPENIVLTEPDTKILLADFGAAARIGQNRGYPVTTAAYCSPEGFDYNCPYAVEHDIFSFGVCLGFMDTKGEPWSELGKWSVDELALLVEANLDSNKRTNFGNRKMSSKVAALVHWCWEQASSQRPSHDLIEAYITDVLNPNLK